MMILKNKANELKDSKKQGIDFKFKYSKITITENIDKQMDKTDKTQKKIFPFTTKTSRQISKERKIKILDIKNEIDKEYKTKNLQTINNSRASNYSTYLKNINVSNDLLNVLNSYERIDTDLGTKTQSNFLKYKDNPPKRVSLSKLDHKIQSLKNSYENTSAYKSSMIKDNFYKKYITSTNSPKQTTIRLANTFYKPIKTEPAASEEDNFFKKEYKRLRDYIKRYIRTNGDYPRTKLDFYKIGKVFILNLAARQRNIWKSKSRTPHRNWKNSCNKII
jgi:hypothetical protein